MRSTFSGCKFNWFIPIVGFFFISGIMNWVYEPDDSEVRLKREAFIIMVWIYIQITTIYLLAIYFKLI